MFLFSNNLSEILRPEAAKAWLRANRSRMLSVLRCAGAECRRPLRQKRSFLISVSFLKTNYVFSFSAKSIEFVEILETDNNLMKMNIYIYIY